MLPLYHDFSGETVVIVGGGSVALRKARRFAEEANVLVLAGTFEDAFDDVDCELKRTHVTAESVRTDVTDSYLVIPATDDSELNANVATIAEREGCLVNRVDKVGDVVVPACVRSDDVSVAVSTNGASPATSKYLRQRLTPIVRQTEGMVRIQRTLRAELKRGDRSQDERATLLWQVIESDDVWALLPEHVERAETVARDIVDL